MSEIDGLIQRLDAWLQENRPEYYTSLNPGATDEEIVELETSLGWKLPEDFVALYKWKNGENSDIGLFGYACFLPIRQIFAEVEINLKPENSHFWRHGFLPIIYDAGDYIGLDSLGQFDSPSGKIAYTYHDNIPTIYSIRLKDWIRVYLETSEYATWDSEECYKTFSGKLKESLVDGKRSS